MSSNLAFESKSTWYEAQTERQPAGEPLSGAVEADICIVGAGLAGLFLAKELTERHRSALIIEARRIGAVLQVGMVDFVAPAGRVEDHKLRSEWGLSRPRPCLISLAKAIRWSRMF